MKLFKTSRSFSYGFLLFTVLACHSQPPKPKGTNAVANMPENFLNVSLPNGYYGRGLSTEYNIYTDAHAGVNGKDSVPTIVSVGKEIKEFATVLKSFTPDKCRGKRIQYTGYLKSNDITGWAGLWMRVDPPNPRTGRTLAFDNMQGRPVKGTTNWQKYSVVLDVPDTAGEIYYGILLAGKGQVWVDSMGIQIVGNDVPVTDMYADNKLPGL